MAWMSVLGVGWREGIHTPTAGGHGRIHAGAGTKVSFRLHCPAMKPGRGLLGAIKNPRP